jgi:hypothetical protein
VSQNPHRNLLHSKCSNKLPHKVKRRKVSNKLRKVSLLNNKENRQANKTSAMVPTLSAKAGSEQISFSAFLRLVWFLNSRLLAKARSSQRTK